MNKNFKTMKKGIQLIIICLFIALTAHVQAQVSGLSYTISPYAEQNWTNQQSGLKNGTMGGAMLGMGFGQFVELRANYARGLGFQTDLSKFGFDATDEQLLAYTPRDIDFSRYGGELKLNLSKGSLLPYLTLGTGVQSIGYDSLSTSKQIYLNAGLGVLFSAGDRYTIGLQAINTRYNFSSVNSLMDDTERAAYGLIQEEFLAEPISNWSLRASLVLYLGGRKPGEITDIDQAYMDNFSGGFRGLNVPFALQASKMDFHEDLPFRDTYMAGGSAGLNFGPLVGVKGFYWRALEDGSNTSFDQLAMYGAEASFKLNEGKGFTPWLTLGAGNIHVGEDYVGNFVDTMTVSGIENKGFAMAGLGIDLPFSKYVKATGFVRSILTTSQDFEDITRPEQLKTSWNYGVSLNFVIGRNKKKINVVKQSAFDEYILASNNENSQATQELKDQYEQQIQALEGKLNQAVIEQDAAAVKEINEEKERTQKVIDQLSGRTANTPQDQMNQGGYSNGNNNNNGYGNGNNNGYNNNNSYGNRMQPSSEIRMSPSEFNLLMRDIMDGMNKGGNSQGAAPKMNTGGNNQDIDSAISNFKKEQQIEMLQKSLEEIKTSLGSITNAQTTLKEENKDLSNTLEKLVYTMKNQVESLDSKLANNQKSLEAMEARQAMFENGLSEATDEQIKIKSFESDQLQRDIDFTNEKIDALKDMMISTLSSVNVPAQQTPVDNNSSSETTQTVVPAVQKSNTQSVQTAKEYVNNTGFFSKFRYNGMSGFTGFNIGGTTTFNLGYRLHYQIADTKFEFVPETFFGFGSPTAFGISANGLYKMDFFSKTKSFVPYVGLGLGFMKVGDDLNADKLTGAYNFIIGSSLNVFSGDLYVDLTARNAFKYNQLIVGYRFPF